jgi:hypothetical protein
MCCCCHKIKTELETEPEWIDWPPDKKLPPLGEWRDAGELGKFQIVATRQNQWNAAPDVIISGYLQIQVRFAIGPPFS